VVKGGFYMAKEIKKGVIRVYFKMLKVWSALLLGIVGIFSLKDSFAQYRPEDRQVAYGVQVEKVEYNMEKQWKGVSANRDYPKDVHKIIKDKVCLEKEWRKLGISTELPKVDFTKDMVIEIVKINSPKGLMLEDAWYARKTNNEIFYNSYFDSAVTDNTLAYFFVVIRGSDLPLSLQENKFVDGNCIATYNYLPVKCD